MRFDEDTTVKELVSLACERMESDWDSYVWLFGAEDALPPGTKLRDLRDNFAQVGLQVFVLPSDPKPVWGPGTERIKGIERAEFTVQ